MTRCKFGGVEPSPPARSPPVSRDGVRVTLPFLKRRKFWRLRSQDKHEQPKQLKERPQMCCLFYFKPSSFDLGANQPPELLEGVGLAKLDFLFWLCRAK